MIQFWENTFNHVMKNYFKSSAVKKSELKETFTFHRFYPACFESVFVITKSDINDNDNPEYAAKKRRYNQI